MGTALKTVNKKEDHRLHHHHHPVEMMAMMNAQFACAANRTQRLHPVATTAVASLVQCSYIIVERTAQFAGVELKEPLEYFVPKKRKKKLDVY